ncbi:MAG: hypothetical protein Q9227_009490 [Pyrenula ochraceoflavens]
MPFNVITLGTIAFIVATHASSLQNICTTAFVQSSLPPAETYPEISIDSSSVNTNAVFNASVTGSQTFPDAIVDYCDVAFTYSHDGRDDQVLVRYWLPSPESFQNRYLSTGGGGLAINSGNSSLPGGIIYGAVAGETDGGFGGFDIDADDVWLLANGTVNWQTVYMFGYQAHHELSTIGKELTKRVYNMSDARLYSYYQGCSEGGREGWSQVQRYGDEWDGAVIGAPAFRYSFQQVQHLYSNVVEQTMSYFPPPCELEKIVNETIAACDLLDGNTDGVVARSDLCKLQFNINSTLGVPYYCAATSGGFGPTGPSSPQPAQNGTVSMEGISVAQTILDGLHDSEGRQVYFSYQPAASFKDAMTQYNSANSSWGLSINGLGGEYVEKFLHLMNATNLPNLDGVTYDTLKEWIYQGWQLYDDSLQTNWPDLTPFHEAGGKVLHYHGESDYSIPAASSVRYYESVRTKMYSNVTYNESTSALNDWYRLFLIPGAAHCAPNVAQPNGPFPRTNLAVLIDWVEKDIEPVTLNATVLLGQHFGESQQICRWPLRPLWTGNGTSMDCVYDQDSIDSWTYDLDAFNLPVY